jgi:hypothetical protein
MFSDNHSVLIAALMLPGIYLACQAIALVIRLTLGHVYHPAWRIGVLIAAVLYTLVLSANVTSLEHTFSLGAPAHEVVVAHTPSMAREITASKPDQIATLMMEPVSRGRFVPTGADVS